MESGDGHHPVGGKTYVNTHVKKGDDYPATYVSWNDAQDFIKKLNKKKGMTYRLPTESEWEYACRAGSTTKYTFGNDEKLLGRYAWYDKNALDVKEKYAHRVSQKRANKWGLYDMHGNVLEWCEDKWHDDYKGAPTNGSAWTAGSGSQRVKRGGDWNNYSGSCRSALRYGSFPGRRNFDLGFRVASSPVPGS